MGFGPDLTVNAGPGTEVLDVTPSEIAVGQAGRALSGERDCAHAFEEPLFDALEDGTVATEDGLAAHVRGYWWRSACGLGVG